MFKFSATFLLSLAVFSITAQSFKDKNLSAQKRAEDLVSRLTLEEKIGLLVDVSQPVERLGIKTYNWWNEALHGVARAGQATVFPQPIGMAATFNDPLVYTVFNAISDEARAKNTYFSQQGNVKRYQGLTMWTPNINIYRDPRWGRGIETYGEDPYLTSRMGVAVVKGLQSPGESKYDKLHACAKHYAVHSGPEWNRHSFNAADIDVRDLYETYLPAFEVLVKEGKVKEVMCAYNSFEGEPCCGSSTLLTKILREEWGFDGIVVADCGAIADFFNERGHQFNKDASEASAKALLTGTDLDCGSSYKALKYSVEKGYVAEKDIDISVIRLMRARFELGEMDELSDVSWSQIPYSIVSSNAHDSLALKIARESMTLLQNKKSILPLKRGKLKIAVMGPNANDSVMQWGNYNGTPQRTSTILSGIQELLGKNDQLIFEKGCGLVENTHILSAFNSCKVNNTLGFSAKYWNNLNRVGDVAANDQIKTPFKFSTGGATTFCPGVELKDFSAQYNTVFTATKTGELVFNFYVCGEINLSVDNQNVKGVRASHGSRTMVHKMKVEANKSYDIQIDFNYVMGDAELNFDLGYQEEMNIIETLQRIKEVDVVVFAGGLSSSLEGEEMGINIPGFKKGDRTSIQLPAVQRQFLSELKKSGKKVVFVNCSGSPIGLEPELKNCDAILQAWYPGQAGGKAVAEVLFGEYNPAGRLPVTFYKDTTQIPDFENYSMRGRTYRYMTQKPTFSFGYGLSYSKFKYGKAQVSSNVVKTGNSLKVIVPVKNSSKIVGEEVVQIYLNKLNDPKGPIKTLRAYKRVKIPAGRTEKVEFELTEKQLEWWNSAKFKVEMHPGKYQLKIGGNSDENQLQTVNFEIN